eukprot:TRINITY_DN1856_c0_g2_i1.p1 TRINITY_DN1856_c0_g2~~TRINITY_DN1856_c0_g2_i1.p1  ORF type:complete len:318 (-),score=37.87 TRINITY_DN1856_c0_g2_i1:35-922(-)
MRKREKSTPKPYRRTLSQGSNPSKIVRDLSWLKEPEPPRPKPKTHTEEKLSAKYETYFKVKMYVSSKQTLDVVIAFGNDKIHVLQQETLEDYLTYDLALISKPKFQKDGLLFSFYYATKPKRTVFQLLSSQHGMDLLARFQTLIETHNGSSKLFKTLKKKSPRDNHKIKFSPTERKISFGSPSNLSSPSSHNALDIEPVSKSLSSVNSKSIRSHSLSPPKKTISPLASALHRSTESTRDSFSSPKKMRRSKSLRKSSSIGEKKKTQKKIDYFTKIVEHRDEKSNDRDINLIDLDD